MNSNDLQSIAEAYNQIHQLDELAATGGTIGFEVGRGRKGVTASVNTDKGSVSGAFGTQKVRGQTSTSDAVDDALNRLNNPTAAAKPSAPERTVPYGRVDASFSGGSAPKPATPPTTSAKPTPVRPKTPDVKRPAEVKTPDVKRPVEFDKPKFEDPRRKMMMGGGDMGRGMREQLAYYQLLNYLIGEGYASTEESADKIILNMSESWFEDIMELNRYEK